jgi:hypothetical protein
MYEEFSYTSISLTANRFAFAWSHNCLTVATCHDLALRHGWPTSQDSTERAESNCAGSVESWRPSVNCRSHRQLRFQRQRHGLRRGH